MNGFKRLRVEKSRVDLLNVESSPTFPIKRKKKFFTWRRILFSCLLIVILVSGWLVYAGTKTLKSITQGDANIFKLFSKVNADEVKSDNGRTNILIIGLGGENHPGGNLTDTIMIASIDLKTNKMALISIPRDLYVTIPGYGKGKINSAYSQGESSKKNSNGIDLLKQTISQTFDIPIHYYIKGDFVALTKLVDAVGGVTVEVTKAIYDPYYPADNMRDYAPFKISAGTHQLDGKTALKYARSRETTNDFDRSRRQQQIIIALKDKMLKTQVLTNPIKINEILGILGTHIKTDLGTPEFKFFSSIAHNLSSNQIKTKVFDTSVKGGLIADTGQSGYILVPRTGNFKNMSAEIKNILNSDAEKPTLAIVNATGKKTLPTNLETTLTGLGVLLDTTTSSSTQKVSSLTVKDDKTNTDIIQKLKTTFSISKVTVNATQETDFVLTVGSSYGN